MNANTLRDIIHNSPSVELLSAKNRTFIILFLVEVFAQERAVSSELIHYKLENYIEVQGIESDEENEITFADTYEDKAKKYIQKWTAKSFLSNYQNETGEIFYELSSHTNKAIDWLSSLKKKEYIGTESKFKTLFHQLKELVEFTNEDREKRLQWLADKKATIEQQIRHLKMGENVQVFEAYQIVSRFNELNKLAKELLSDFKEVDENFKTIIKEIYQQQTDLSLKKGDILQNTFDALAQLKESAQGKSFYAFWTFLLSQALQQDWENLILNLYQTLEEKNMNPSEVFLKNMKRHLFDAGKKVFETNDKMAEKLSRIIRETEISKTEATKRVMQEIKNLLLEISKNKAIPDVSFEIEEIEIYLPMERKLTYERTEEIVYNNKARIAKIGFEDLCEFEKLYNPYVIDKHVLRKHIKDILKQQSQSSLTEIIATQKGLSKGLSELFAYFSILKDFQYVVNEAKTEVVLFDSKHNKSILIPEIILTR